jgi:GNAT superfamily N-acetyltransferase
VSSYRSEHLCPHHDLTAFDSGSPPLDEWLRRFARHAESANTGRTFVWVGQDPSAVVGYFTLAAHLVRRADLPARIVRGSPDAIPAILLARIALDRSLQGRGLGCQLLLDALERAVEASNRAAGRMIVVDAIDERAQTFYQHFGFQLCPGTNRLVRKTSDVATAILSQ